MSFDAIVVGGGFTGCALAAALAQGRRRVLVLEARRGPRKRYAGELLHPTGADVLSSLGLRAPLEQAGAMRVEGFAVYSPTSTSATLLPYAAGHGIASAGLAMDHDKMVGVLRGEVERRPGVEVRYGERVTGLAKKHGRIDGVVTERGDVEHAPLVLSAEGRHSHLRAELGVPVESRLLSYTAVVTVDDAVLPHCRHGHIFLGPSGPILAYAVGDGRARLCFDLAVRKHPRDLSAHLLKHFAPQIPAPFRAQVQASLRARDPQLVATHSMLAAQVVKDGMVLVGDAGACAHPLTAGGMTLCLNDVQLLAKSLRWRAPELALGVYERERVAMLTTRIALTDALYEIFSSNDQGTAALRDGVFRYWQDSRARGASIALLAGADSSRMHLIAEYARVVAQSIRTRPRAARAIARTAIRHGLRFLKPNEHQRKGATHENE